MGEPKILLHKVPEHSYIIGGRVKKLKQSPGTDIHEELIDKILKPLIQLEEAAGDADADTRFMQSVRWKAAAL